MSEFQIVGYGVPENAVDAAHMFVDSDQWIRVDQGGDPFSQEDLDSGWTTDIVVRASNGRYYTMTTTEWEGEDLQDLLDYIEDWLATEYE